MSIYRNLINQSDPAYRQWLQSHNEDLIGADESDTVVLYGNAEIEEANDINEMSCYLPGHLIIGNDSGDNAFIMKGEPGSPIYMVGFGSLRREDFEFISTSFKEWRISGFKVPEPSEYHLPLHADIYINSVPIASVGILAELKKLLQANWPAHELHSRLQHQPFLAQSHGHPIALEQRLKQLPHLKPYVFYQSASGELRHICC